MKTVKAEITKTCNVAGELQVKGSFVELEEDVFLSLCGMGKAKISEGKKEVKKAKKVEDK